MSEMMPSKLLFASHNTGKIREIRSLFTPLGIEIASATDFNLSEPVEDGTTFRENAFIKALSAHKTAGIAAFADDSGLSVDALNGAPGVYTARYGGYNKLLEALNKTPPEGRTAQFNCTIAYVTPHGEPVYFEGITKGFIATEVRKESDFGFDPVFIPAGSAQTYAEMTPEEKHETSARAKAIALFVNYLKKF